MWTSGRLADIAVDRVLLLVAARSSTGTLSVQNDDVLAVRFRNGEIVGADALKESLTHGLGRILVASGHLNRDQVAAIEAAELEGTVVDHLLVQNLVPADTLAGCVRQHTYLLLLRLLGWKTGEYKFYEGEVGWTLEPRPLSVEEVLVRASEEDPRLLGVTLPPLGYEVLKPLLGRRAFRVLSWQEESGASAVEGEWLTPFEDALLRSLDGLTPSIDFKERLGVDEFRLRFALHRLDRAGLVETARAAPVGAAPSASAAVAEAAEPSGAVGADAIPALPPPSATVPGTAASAAPPETAVSRAARLSDLGGQLGDLSRAFSVTLAAGLAILVLAVVMAGGSMPRLHHPFPWQEADRQRLEALRVAAVHRDLTGRLKIYHLLYGTFPLDLRPLIDTALVRAGDLRDNHGRDVSFEALEQGFVLGIEEDEEGETTAHLRSRYSVTGDFLLDPEFAPLDGERRGAAVQLLD